jgi:hypothetical protein
MALASDLRLNGAFEIARRLLQVERPLHLYRDVLGPHGHREENGGENEMGGPHALPNLHERCYRIVTASSSASRPSPRRRADRLSHVLFLELNGPHRPI